MRDLVSSSLVLTILVTGVATDVASSIVAGTVREAAPPHVAVADARVTIFTPGLSAFHEARTDASGAYALDVAPGTYRIGCAAPRYGYVESSITVGAGDLPWSADLDVEAEPGVWTTIGTTEPEFLDATDIGLLLPDGRIFYCHDTTDPILFDPVSGERELPPGSDSEQGCMNGSLLPDGRVILAGGQDGADPGDFRDAIPWVKAFDPLTGTWERLDDMTAPDGRWYPGLARLADGSLLAMGGGTAPSAERTETCERLDLSTLSWATTGSMLNPSEFSPVALLHTGEVLATWSPPQLYDPGTGTWRPTGDFVQPARGWPDHSDHSLVVLADGRALAIGARGYAGGAMGETFDPVSETWSTTSSPALVRFQSEVVALPDGRMLVAGGETEAVDPPVEDVLGIVTWTDLFDPERDTWRRVADMPTFREYHGVSLLVPDGRVVVTGGTRIKFTYGPTSADIEAYSPPYLFRGVRPEIGSISTTSPSRGDEVTLEIEPATTLTDVVLMGTQSHTHWVDAGVPRRLVLAPVQAGSTVTVTLPSDLDLLPLGHYMLFAMVDDIPSEGVIIRIEDPTTAGTGSPPVADTMLLSARPNPSRGRTAIRMELNRSTPLEVAVYAVDGRRVRTLLRRETRDGTVILDWDGRDDAGRRVAAGTYLVRGETPAQVTSVSVRLVP